MAQRGITVSCEAIRLWCIKFGAIYARRLKRKHQGYGDSFHINKVFVRINGKQHYLWRAVDQDGGVVDVFVQAKRDGAAAVRFFTYQCDTNSVAWELESELNDVDRPVFFLEKDVSLARLSWPKSTAIGQRAW